LGMWILRYAMDENHCKGWDHRFLGACKNLSYKFLNMSNVCQV